MGHPRTIIYIWCSRPSTLLSKVIILVSRNTIIPACNVHDCDRDEKANYTQTIETALIFFLVDGSLPPLPPPPTHTHTHTHAIPVLFLYSLFSWPSNHTKHGFNMLVHPFHVTVYTSRLKTTFSGCIYIIISHPRHQYSRGVSVLVLTVGTSSSIMVEKL